jgi:hypothetical protein
MAPAYRMTTCCTLVDLTPDWHGESCSATPIYQRLSHDTNLAIARNDLSIAIWQWRHEVTYHVFDDGTMWPMGDAR